MFSEYSTYVACGFAALAALVAARLLLVTRPVSLRRSVIALRGWHVVDRVQLEERSTLDHVIVSPAALLAVTSTAHEPGRAELHTAEHAARQLRDLARGAGVADAVVVPVVLVSGPDAPSGGHQVVAGVHVVDDAAPDGWLRLFREARIAAAPRLALARTLDCRAVPARRTRRSTVLLAPPEPAGA